MQKLTLFLLSLFMLNVAAAQVADTNSYRSLSNPFYWKNKKPHEGYWQQDVHYTIKANIDEKTDVVDAEEALIYYNNSPHDLDRVYFNLYNKNYEPGSYLDDLHHANKVYPKYGNYEKQHLTTEVSELKYNGNVVKTELDGSILAVYLDKPIKAGESAKFDIKFKTYFDMNNGVRRRTKVFNSSGYHHFDGVLWYPRIAVYDQKFGWVTDQHLGREFYGDFGSFHVELTFANDYVVDATGLLLNEEEVLPEELRKKLDISNFKSKPVGSAPSIITPRDGTKKTWKYYAKNVHDFGFTADPTYRIGEVKWNNIRCFSFAQESNAARWQNAASYLANIIRVFSTDFGMYCWPKISVCDARDGMEYPMMTLDGGYDPDYRTLFTHEVGHQWFYGQVGSNETYRAALDEGFTQFLTVWAYEKIDGPVLVELPAKSGHIRKHKKKDKVRETKIFLGYLGDAIERNDMPLTTHSDDFNGALRQGGGYRHVYVKTAAMLQNLQYVLGDELFLAAMKNYFDEWKIAHPYIEDFRRSIINYTHVDLNWFFDQWFETTKVIDYKIADVSKTGENDKYAITFKRKGSMQMPIDFTVKTKNDSSYHFHIPNTWFVKKTSATVLPRWIGWGKLRPEYTAVVTVPGKIKQVMIDTSGRLADVNMRNNYSKRVVDWSYDHMVYNYPDRFHYQMKWRPDIWYNGYDGIKAGLHFNGNYMNTRDKFSFTTWFNTGIGQQSFVPASLRNEYDRINYNLSYKTNTPTLIKHSSVYADSRFLDGLVLNMIGFDIKNYSNTNRFFVYAKSMYRADSAALQYLIYPTEWNRDMFNNTLNVGFEHSYLYKRGHGNLSVATRGSALYSDYHYGNISFTAENLTRLGKFDLRTRTFAQYGTGTNWAPESFLFIAGANPEALMENKFTRSAGIVPSEWSGYDISVNHFHQGGGLNLRGYAGYLGVEGDTLSTSAVYKTTSGAAINAELDFSKLIGLKKAFFRNTLKIETYLFYDIGVANKMADKDFAFILPRADAGLGTLWTIQRWGPLQMARPLTIRFDMPVFLSRPPNIENEYLAFRWVVGIGKSF